MTDFDGPYEMYVMTVVDNGRNYRCEMMHDDATVYVYDLSSNKIVGTYKVYDADEIENGMKEWLGVEAAA
jgi:hypothetical protein